MKKFLRVIASLIVLCLIAIIPKEAFSPEVLEALRQIYFEKHPGVQKATVTVGENKAGQVAIIIDQPKQEI